MKAPFTLVHSSVVGRQHACLTGQHSSDNWKPKQKELANEQSIMQNHVFVTFGITQQLPWKVVLLHSMLVVIIF